MGPSIIKERGFKTYPVSLRLDSLPEGKGRRLSAVASLIFSPSLREGKARNEQG